MADLSASTEYKKQQGTLAISRDKRSVIWTPSNNSSTITAISIDVAKVTNLQQTPPNKPRVVLRIFVKETTATEPIPYDFRFTSATDARGEANVLRDAISAIIPKATDARPNQQNSNGQSAAMTIAAAISGSRGSAPWEDDERLIEDFEVQRDIMKVNPDLSKAFTDAQANKPDSLSLIQFNKQFWSSRVHLLRAHVLAKSQKKGLYNVFSNIKWSTDEGSEQRSVSLTTEHINAIFVQYPVMLRIYDELVPRRLNEHDFWSRFIQSQLFSTLKGLKVDRRTAARDAIFDQYLDLPEVTGIAPIQSDTSIPKFIDLEGNEENHSQRKGNRPDAENRQGALEKGPIIRRLNAISEKLMVAVKPSDVDASAPVGVDEHEFEQLRLRDLALEEEHQGIPLNIRDQSIFSNNKQSSDDIDSARIRALDPSQAIRDICAELDRGFSQSGQLSKVDIDFEDEDEDMDDDDDTTTKPHIAGAMLASDHIHGLIEAHRSQYIEANTTTSTNLKSYGGLSETVYDRLVLTHATTTEFLHQFWMAFYSGDSSRVADVAALKKSLENARGRIDAVAQTAQEERDTKIEQLEAQAAEIFKKSGKKKQINKKLVGGGAEVVRQLMQPCIQSLHVAIDTYNQAFEEQTRHEDGQAMEE